MAITQSQVVPASLDDLFIYRVRVAIQWNQVKDQSNQEIVLTASPLNPAGSFWQSTNEAFPSHEQEGRRTRNLRWRWWKQKAGDARMYQQTPPNLVCECGTTDSQLP